MNPLKQFAMKHFNLIEAQAVEETPVEAPVEAVQFAQIADAEGVIYSYEGDQLTVGAKLYLGEEGSVEDAPAGTISLEDGSQIVVGEMGIVEELIEGGTEDEAAPEEEEALASPQSVKETVTTETTFNETEFGGNLEQILFAVSELIEPITARLDALEGANATELSAAKEEIAKLSAMPSANSHQVNAPKQNPKTRAKFSSVNAKLQAKYNSKK